MIAFRAVGGGLYQENVANQNKAGTSREPFANNPA